MPPTSRYTYDEQSGRYRGPDGRFVPASAVRAELDAVLAREAKAMQQLGEQLRARKISLARFEIQMRERIKSMQLASVALSRGGWGQMRDVDYLRAARATKREYAYLRARVRAVATGETPRDGRLARIVASYSQAARATYEDARRAEMAVRGYDEEQSVRHALDSCSTVGDTLGCIEAEAAGWQPIGTLPLPGRRVCRVNCKCNLRFRNSDTGKVAA